MMFCGSVHLVVQLVPVAGQQVNNQILHKEMIDVNNNFHEEMIYKKSKNKIISNFYSQLG